MVAPEDICTSEDQPASHPGEMIYSLSQQSNNQFTSWDFDRIGSRREYSGNGMVRPGWQWFFLLVVRQQLCVPGEKQEVRVVPVSPRLP